nr:MAG TPA: hypothetical protein [Caudoviricetes sp.]
MVTGSSFFHSFFHSQCLLKICLSQWLLNSCLYPSGAIFSDFMIS